MIKGVNVALHPKALNLAFDIIVCAAKNGDRCPINGSEGVPHGATNTLAGIGKIKLEIYCLNWRVAEILEGPYRGLRTKECPHKHNGPYLVIGSETVRNTRMSRQLANAS